MDWELHPQPSYLLVLEILSMSDDLWVDYALLDELSAAPSLHKSNSFMEFYQHLDDGQQLWTPHASPYFESSISCEDRIRQFDMLISEHDIWSCCQCGHRNGLALCPDDGVGQVSPDIFPDSSITPDGGVGQVCQDVVSDPTIPPCCKCGLPQEIPDSLSDPHRIGRYYHGLRSDYHTDGPPSTRRMG